MSLEAIAQYGAVRKRLLNPPNGRISSDLEVIPDYVREKARKRREFEAREAERREELANKLARMKRIAAETISKIKARHERTSSLHIATIMEIAAEHYGKTIAEVIGERRTLDITMPRHVGMYLAKVLTQRSFPAIARAFGRMDHTTILYACKKIERLINTDAGFAATIENLKIRVLARLDASTRGELSHA